MNRLNCKDLLAGLLVVIACSLTQSALALDTTDANKQFVGTWQAQFQGKSFLTIKLDELNGKLTGTISRVQVQLDQNGELTSAQSQDGDDTISDTNVSGKVLHFTSRDANGQDATQYEMELSTAGESELIFVGQPSGTQVPKPWKLTKLQTADQAAQKAPSMKDKLAAAAQIWMSGQMGTKAPATGSGATENANPSSGATPAANAPTVKVSEVPLEADLRKIINAQPRRVNDRFGNQGDMVNFVIVGSLEQVQAALDAASWHVADTDSKESALKAVMETYDKKDYLTMPMSRLYLFDRVQDFGYEQAEPYAVVASRHHFRLWKTTATWNGQPVWVGAGTHDIGFEKDQRNGKVTHKIDPAVDGERDNVGSSLQKTDKTKTVSYYLPPDPVQDARNATGGGYHSDGRLLVVVLK
jgi:hypothetical protein